MTSEHVIATATIDGEETRLVAGDVLTGAEIDSLVILNGVVKLTRVDVSSHQRWVLHRWVSESDDYSQAWGTYADWTYFCHSEPDDPDRVRIVTATPDVVEWVDEWDAYALNVPTLSNNGIVNRDDAAGVNYTSGAVLKYITETTLRKVGRLERGADGYFAGWHSDPRVGPPSRKLPAQNNESAYGEREMGTGGDSRVFFASSGFECLHPDWGSDARWGVYSPTNRHAWPGIDDANYGVQAAAEYIALQDPGFPAEQTTGPWWVADLDYRNATSHPFCRYVHMVGRMECGSWQFAASHYGSTVIHFINQYVSESGVPHTYQLYLGAIRYDSDNLTAEPTTDLRSRVANREPIYWPQSGDVRFGSKPVVSRPVVVMTTF
jgi:hypothetical protein